MIKKTHRVISLFLLLVPFFVIAQKHEPAEKLRSLIESFHFNGAVTFADQCLLIDSTNIDLLLLKSQSLTSVFRYKEAITSLRRAQRLDSTNILVLNELMNVYHQSGDLKKAIEVGRSIAGLDPENRYFKLQLANLYYSNKDYDQAINVLLPLYHSDTSDFYVVKQLAYCYDETKRNDSALFYCRKSLKIIPFDPFMTNKLANIFLRENEVNTAFYITAIYLQHDSTDGTILKQNAYCNYLIHDYQASAKQFQKCLKMGDSTKFTIKYLGLSFYKQDKFDSAARFFWSAFRHDTTDAEVCFYFGVSKCRSNSIDTGMGYLQRTLDMLMPSGQFLSSIYSELANAYTMKGNADTGILFLNKAIEKNPGNNTLRFKLAYQYDYYLHKPIQALPWYREFLKNEPPQPEHNLWDKSSISRVVKTGTLEITGSYFEYATNRLKVITDQNNLRGSGVRR